MSNDHTMAEKTNQMLQQARESAEAYPESRRELPFESPSTRYLTKVASQPFDRSAFDNVRNIYKRQPSPQQLGRTPPMSDSDDVANLYDNGGGNKLVFPRVPNGFLAVEDAIQLLPPSLRPATEQKPADQEDEFANMPPLVSINDTLECPCNDTLLCTCCDTNDDLQLRDCEYECKLVNGEYMCVKRENTPVEIIPCAQSNRAENMSEDKPRRSPDKSSPFRFPNLTDALIEEIATRQMARAAKECEFVAGLKEKTATATSGESTVETLESIYDSTAAFLASRTTDKPPTIAPKLVEFKSDASRIYDATTKKTAFLGDSLFATNFGCDIPLDAKKIYASAASKAIPKRTESLSYSSCADVQTLPKEKTAEFLEQWTKRTKDNLFQYMQTASKNAAVGLLPWSTTLFLTLVHVGKLFVKNAFADKYEQHALYLVGNAIFLSLANDTVSHLTELEVNLFVSYVDDVMRRV